VGNGQLLERDVGEVHGLRRKAFLHPGTQTVVTVHLHHDRLRRPHRYLTLPQAVFLL
jgi:hypothetical protein